MSFQRGKSLEPLDEISNPIIRDDLYQAAQDLCAEHILAHRESLQPFLREQLEQGIQEKTINLHTLRLKPSALALSLEATFHGLLLESSLHAEEMIKNIIQIYKVVCTCLQTNDQTT
jgi:hypothetical protein